MKVAIRADASLSIGTGHIMRCCTLAQELSARGAEILFICRDHAGGLGERLTREKFDLRILPAPADEAEVTIGESDYARWLGVSEAADVKQTIAALGGEQPDWLVVDHYALSTAWEQALRPHASRILAVDDLARAHAADVVLDQNYAAAPDGRYEGLLPSKSRLLLGPHYALLQPEYAAFAARGTRSVGPVRRILVFFGGADPANLTGAVLEALSHADFAEIEIDVVVGAASRHAAEVSKLAALRGRTNIHRDVPTLAGLMAAADLAIGAGGGATWERCCLGLPSIIASIADNQLSASLALGAAGIVDYLGRREDLDKNLIRDAVRALISDAPRRLELSERGRLLVDGYGAQRVAEVLMPSSPQDLGLRRATLKDRDYLFRLANDPLVRRHSFNPTPIGWQTHCAWFEARMSNPNCMIFVLEARGLAVGQFRVDLTGGIGMISYALDPIARGRGWGGTLVESGLRAATRTRPLELHAEVGRDNPASCAVFAALGFREAASGEEKVRYVLDAPTVVSRFGGEHLT